MEITSRKNQLVKYYKSLINERKARRENGSFVAEGHKICEEAVKSGLAVKSVLATKAALAKYAETAEIVSRRCEIVVINDDISEYISDTKTPQGFFAEVKTLDKPLNSVTIRNSTRFLILDSLQDAGNIGTIIRTGDALGIDGVILTEECADIYSPKVIRGTMGSLFRLPCYIGRAEELIPMLKAEGFSVYGAMLDKSATPLNRLSFSEKSAVVIGNEGSGICEKVQKLCTQSVYIPIENAESLNAAVAASILCWEMQKQKGK